MIRAPYAPHILLAICCLCIANATQAMGYGLPSSRLERCLAELGAEPADEPLIDCLTRRAQLEQRIRPQCTNIVARKYRKITPNERVRHIQKCMNASLKKSYTQMSKPITLEPSSAPNNPIIDPETGETRAKRRGEGKPNYFGDIPRHNDNPPSSTNANE